MSEAWKRNLAVPFFTQRDNTYIWQQVATEDEIDSATGKKTKEKGKPFGPKYPMAWRTCNITSLCMLLHYWGITEDDFILERDITIDGDEVEAEFEFNFDVEKVLDEEDGNLEIFCRLIFEGRDLASKIDSSIFVRTTGARR